MNTSTPEDSNLRPLMLLGGSIVFVAAILIADGAIGNDRKADRDVNLPRGGGGTSLLPGAPMPGLQGGSPVPDGGPSVTIIQDVRETMNRLPLDRNNPEGSPGYKPPGPGPKPRKPG